ncbi:MAG: ABC transporter permease subunit [Firmicutes bacterium]|nr:ABC transporter permease subunit [Bacillota bacterium]
MGKYNEFLYDDIGNEYSRKHLYLQELARHQSTLKSVSASDKEKVIKSINVLTSNRKNHPYHVELEAFKKAERNFKVTLNAKLKLHMTSLDPSLDRKQRAFESELFKAKEKVNFYQSYTGLCYDAELEYEKGRLIIEQLPEIMLKYKNTVDELDQAKAHLEKIDPKKEEAFKSEYKAFKADQQKRYRDGVQKLKDKRAAKNISEKALKNGKIELKKKNKESLTLKSYESDKRATKELIGNKKYILSKGIKRDVNVMKSNISDVRRRMPMEVLKTKPFYAWLTAPLPGLGQLLNKQFFKAILFAIGSLFIYGIAIPYALGFGNYQGDGIAGLVTLASEGKKIDKSLIFMIEGIVAIFLVAFSIAIYLISYFDVLKVEKDIIKGIRPRNWFESLTKVESEGFPYLVSLPALIVTIFIVIVPITTAIMLSFTGMNPKNQSKFPWVGFDNYTLIATGSGLAGSVFWSILGWTLVWTLVATSMAILVGFMLAIIAHNDRIKGKTFFRTVFLLPWAVPAFITIMFFSIMFSPNGAITTILNDIFNVQLTVKTDPFYSRVVLILLQTWLGSSYVFLLSTGVLQAIPGDLYEAAQIDGATEWQKLRKITIPIVLFQTAPLLVGQYTFNFNNFSIIYLFNSGGPFNPSKYGNLAGSTDLLISYIYKLTMENQYQSIGAAITIVISLGLMLFAFIGFKNSKAFREERL